MKMAGVELFECLKIALSQKNPKARIGFSLVINVYKKSVIQIGYLMVRFVRIKNQGIKCLTTSFGVRSARNTPQCFSGSWG